MSLARLESNHLWARTTHLLMAVNAAVSSACPTVHFPRTSHGDEAQRRRRQQRVSINESDKPNYSENHGAFLRLCRLLSLEWQPHHGKAKGTPFPKTATKSKGALGLGLLYQQAPVLPQHLRSPRKTDTECRAPWAMTSGFPGAPL